MDKKVQKKSVAAASAQTKKLSSLQASIYLTVGRTDGTAMSAADIPYLRLRN